MVELIDELLGVKLRSGDTVLLDTASGLVLEKLPRPEVEDLVLEEVPDISYDDIGGLDDQIEQIADAVELPFLHQDLFAEHQLPAPKGILLYGPPGCGKTLIAKAVANSLAKKVAAATGQRGRQVATSSTSRAPSCSTSTSARPSARSASSSSARGRRARRAGRSSSSSTRWTRCSAPAAPASAPTWSRTIVPQLLAEIDGVETLKNVIVIGASNREDLIDPAILRPGRLDVKIKIERPNEEAAAQIFARYLTADLPLDEDEVADARRRRPGQVRAVDDRDDRRRDVPHRRGQPVPRGHLPERRQGDHVLQGLLVRRHDREHRAAGQEARHQAPARRRPKGIQVDDLLESIHQEYKEHEDLPNTTNPDDWAKISGKKGERIVYVRTIIQHDDDAEPQGGRSIERVATGASTC